MVYPETLAVQVLTKDGDTVEDRLSEIADILQKKKSEIIEAIRLVSGVEQAEMSFNELSEVIASLPKQMILEVGATTVQYDASHTENIASNDHVRIWGSDNKAYTLAQWNAMFVAAGYDKDAMAVTPKGFAFTKRNGGVEGISWSDYFSDRLWSLDGASQRDNQSLQHSPYQTLACVSEATSGTDAATGNAWSISSDDEADEWVLHTETTGQSFRIPKGLPYVNVNADSDNFEERTESLYQITEWYRHRFAIDSGLTTSEADGTVAEVEILNASGEQAAVGEDMYFWIGGVNTDILAKYNINNLHNTASVTFTAAYATTVYEAQKAQGMNMNDTGVNSDAKMTLAPGCKGAEAVAANGKWMIITPYVTYAANAARFGDAPAVYFVRGKGLSLPSGEALEMWYWNMSLVNALRSYLNNREGRGLPTAGAGVYWSSARPSSYSAWYVSANYGSRLNNVTVNYYRVVGASGL